MHLMVLMKPPLSLGLGIPVITNRRKMRPEDSPTFRARY